MSRHRQHSSSVLGSSGLMAAGTIVSRLTGTVRSAMLAAAIGLGLHGDVFNVANTIPNMLYILLAGGVFNAVLVPQLVRSMRNDDDGGDAYVNRVITAAGMFLAGATAVLIICAPLLMRVLLSHQYFEPGHEAERDSAIAFARFCLPQVFFYGMFVLVGQVLNARGRFGPMMWAPIANNVVSVAVLALYLVANGKTHCAPGGGYSGGQEVLLGVGSTLGIAVQFLVLLPYLRSVGFRYRPRFDLRDAGLGHTLRLGVWTVLFVVANQIAYVVVVKIASGGTADAVNACTGHNTGYSVYSNAYLLIMIPHGIITVSLATATLPRLSRLASNDDLRGLSRELTSTMRTTYAAILPLMALIPIIAHDLASLAFNYGHASSSYTHLVPVLSAFALAVVVYTTHYLTLRGFYALEENRRVFFNQCAVSVTNIVMAIVLTHGASGSQIAVRLAVAYTCAYAVGALLSIAQLSRLVGGLDGARMLRFLVRLVIATGIATVVVLLVRHGLHQIVSSPGKPAVILRLAVMGLLDVLVLLLLGRVMRIGEITEVTTVLTRRLRR